MVSSVAIPQKEIQILHSFSFQWSWMKRIMRFFSELIHSTVLFENMICKKCSLTYPHQSGVGGGRAGMKWKCSRTHNSHLFCGNSLSTLRRSSHRIPSGKRKTKQFQFPRASISSSFGYHNPRSELCVREAIQFYVPLSFAASEVCFFVCFESTRAFVGVFFPCNNTTDFLIMYSKRMVRAFVSSITRLLRARCARARITSIHLQKQWQLIGDWHLGEWTEIRVTANVACEQEPTPEYFDAFREITFFSNHRIYWAHSTISNMKWIISMVTRALVASQVVGAAKNSHLPFITCQLVIMDDFYCLYIAPCPWRALFEQRAKCCMKWIVGGRGGERFLLCSKFTSNLNGARKIRSEWETSTNTLSGPIKFSLLPKLMDSRNEWCLSSSNALAHNVMDRSIFDAFHLGCE